ncbi:MAG TPA: metallophosphoesterase family protein [Candidatus Aphodocola excrementigallinarum]|uniref:Metallophosphoesterase family protein n=1 Tax=Candidatus Aphodocola excrementigallinarum TaxID=2840670 RepID=A0A9D1IMW6_9FIRM|nr:metallophosphoesterase family protein [Candidatus Aphodocola excrementigallinarum]
MDKIAIISDIHGNLEALKVVLKDIEKRNIKRIFCLGDIIAKGTHPHECIKLIKERCNIVLQGNCDEYFTRDFSLDNNPNNKTDLAVKRISWNKSMLTNDDVNYLKNLPYCYEFYLSGRLVRMFHAAPTKINDFIGNIDTLDRLYSLFLPSDNTVSKNKADVVIYGHIHMQFMQRIYNRTIINSGSVGNAIDVFRNDKKDGNVRNTTCANYAVISGDYNSKDYSNPISYELVSVPYDIDKELLDDDKNIEKEDYETELKKGKYRDMTKINKSFKIRGINPKDI